MTFVIFATQALIFIISKYRFKKSRLYFLIPFIFPKFVT